MHRVDVTLVAIKSPDKLKYLNLEETQENKEFVSYTL